jgi:hypothetical protein
LARRGQHRGEITTEILKAPLERNDLRSIEIVETPVNALDSSDPVGRSSQLCGDLGIRRRPALQRKQAYDQLQAVHHPVIGLLAQELLLLDQFVFMTKQRLILSESLPQPV